MNQDTKQTAAIGRDGWRSVGGAALLLFGLLFMAGSLFTVPVLENWWSLFILLPGVLLLGLGRMLRGDRTFSFLSRLCSGGGLVVTAVATMFALHLDWALWWPVMLVVPGTAVWLLGGTEAGTAGKAWVRYARWLGITMMLLGVVFLLDQHQLISLQGLFGNFHWWGFFILIPGIGAFVEGVRVSGDAYTTAWALFLIGIWIVSSGLAELLATPALSWQVVVGIGLIGTGLLSLRRFSPQRREQASL
jgi:hypothetical protein